MSTAALRFLKTGFNFDQAILYLLCDIFYTGFYASESVGYKRKSVPSFPDNKLHAANMGPIWVLSGPDGSMLAPWTWLSGLLDNRTAIPSMFEYEQYSTHPDFSNTDRIPPYSIGDHYHHIYDYIPRIIHTILCNCSWQQLLKRYYLLTRIRYGWFTGTTSHVW